MWVVRDATGDTGSSTYPAPDGIEGIYLSNFLEVGEYEINFTMDGDDSSWSVVNNDPNSTSATTSVILPEIMSVLASGSGGGFYISNPNTIGFGTTNGHQQDQEFAVSNISLTNNTIIFQGGSSGSWNFDGFNPFENNWIYWDATYKRLAFDDAPHSDPNGDGTLLNVNQWIDRPIKENEQYRISFKTKLTSGKFRMYYFNSDGKGFVIDPSFIWPSSYTSGAYFTYGYNPQSSTQWANGIHTIGEDDIDDYEWANLRETFVIQLYDIGGFPSSPTQSGLTDLTNGWIDNISMTRVFSPSGFEEKTLTFSEDVNGWTSFKTFVPESGVSLSKKYFTMKEGGLWQHYVPMVDGDTEYASNGDSIKYTAEEADNYNIFYKTYNPEAIPEPDPSIMQIVLNSDPSTINTFNTLNYEGSQAYIMHPSGWGAFGGGITPNNAQAYMFGQGIDLDGWECTEIKTDMDMGSVKEFIKKEGKWFNYIKGKTVNLSDNPDTSRFSVQGVGKASSVVTVTPPFLL